MAQALKAADVSAYSCPACSAGVHCNAFTQRNYGNSNNMRRFANTRHNGKLPIPMQRNRTASLTQGRSFRATCAANREDVTTLLTETVEKVSLNGSPQKVVAEEKPFANLLEVDKVTEGELKENGFRSTRRTKLVCTIGPACCSAEQLEAMAMGGMNVARLNLCHGTKEWHAQVIQHVRRLNAEKGYSVAVMMDTEGSEIHMGDLGGESAVRTEDGEVWVFTVRKFVGQLPPRTAQVNYEGFAEDMMVGDELVIDGGMVRFEVVERVGPDVHCRCIDPGLLLPRANVTFWRGGHLVREGNSMLPTISSKA
ncbi:hypothetical protein L7F22_037442 [Adiantum nelumboides]|nr:hypothetical protein [Adiantum nelumboides]